MIGKPAHEKALFALLALFWGKPSLPGVSPVTSTDYHGLPYSNLVRIVRLVRTFFQTASRAAARHGEIRGHDI